MKYRALLALSSLLLAGCTVGPDFQSPAPGTPPAWHDPAATAPAGAQPASVAPSGAQPASVAPSGAQPASVAPSVALQGSAPPVLDTAADPQPDWWSRFDDPELSSLIARATQGNFDLKIAVQKILESRADETSMAAQGLPSLSASGSYTREQTSLDALKAQIGGALPASLTPTTAPPAFGLFKGALDASWEIDLFGKVRRSVEAAQATTDASIGDRDNSLVSLQAEVAQTYAKLRAAQADLAAANADIAAERELLDLTGDRTAHGLVSGLDYKNAAAQLASSEAAAPQYEQQIAMYLNGLAVLVGETPGALDAELRVAKPIPSPANFALPIGLPSTLARRRPDIRAAEARLHAQTADVGVAIAQLYPDITLTGEVGQQSQQLKNFASLSNNFYSFGPSISLPIFQGGKLQAAIDQAKAEQIEAELTYRKTVVAALQDVENALASYRTDQQRLQALSTETDASAAAVDIALDRYKHGLSTYLDVLTPRGTLTQSQQQRIAAQLAVTNDLVTLYKALGGGWQASPTQAAGTTPRTDPAASQPDRKS